MQASRLPSGKRLLNTMLWFVIAVTACALQSTEASGLSLPPSDSAAAVTIVDEFVSAWNAHDMNAFGNLFTQDADFVNVVGVWMKGRGDIQRLHTEKHQTTFKSSTLAATVSDFDVLCFNVIVMHMIWSLTGHLDLDMKPAPDARTGIMTIVAVRDAMRWLIHSGQNTDVVARAGATPVG